MGELQQQLREAIAQRDGAATRWSFIGGIAGCIISSGDILGALLGALIGGLIMFNMHSGEVNRIKRIQELSNDR